MKHRSLAKIAFASCAVAVSLMTATPVFADTVSEASGTEMMTSWAESGAGAVNGVWSPDCVGRYQKLPA